MLTVRECPIESLANELRVSFDYCSSALQDGAVGTVGRSADFVVIYGGFSGEAVEGDVLQIDCKVGISEILRT